MLAAALPLTLGETRVTAGIGYAQVIDLDHFYQNNNSLSPYLGQERPPQVFFTDRTDTMHVKWYQYVRSREGSVYGITPALSVTVLPGFTLGASAAILTGSSDDVEHRVERGHLNISITNGVADNFMVDTAYYYQDKVGTSTYSGNMFTFGGHLEQERFSIGVTIKPAMTITREWERTTTSLDTTKKSFPVRIDSLTTRTTSESGTDKLRLPFSYALGIVLTPTKEWMIGFDFVWRNLGEAEFTSGADGTTTKPWVNSSATMRLGIEYRASDIVALRAGYRQDPQAFSPDGSAIINTAASGNIYSAGAGLTFGNILCDLAYEYRWLKYEDTYQSNVNINTQGQHLLFVEVGYRF
jgi:long-subunit fatty acid transport protein